MAKKVWKNPTEEPPKAWKKVIVLVESMDHATPPSVSLGRMNVNGEWMVDNEAFWFRVLAWCDIPKLDIDI